MLEGYYYNETLKRIITVFGSIFNDIHIARKDGSNVSNVMRVPIAYGPTKKFITRLENDTLEDKSIALKLPRMSFEITSIQYDTTSKLNKLNKLQTGSLLTEDLQYAFQSVPYDLGMTLSLYGNSQDDLFQILEQIIPLFPPQYTVSIKGIEGPDLITDVPFSLTGINLTDTYEGPLDQRRAIIYTLDFSIKVKFVGKYVAARGVIHEIDLNFYDKLLGEQDNLQPIETVTITS